MEHLLRRLSVAILSVALVVTPLPAQDQPAPTLDELRKLVAEQQALISAQKDLIETQGGEIAAQKKKLAEMEEALAALSRRLAELEAESPQEREDLDARLKRIEEAASKPAELPPDIVSAGDFPGSIRIPGTDAAIKFGGLIRGAFVFTLAPLGTDDRFLTHSIPVEAGQAGDSRRTAFNAQASRFNVEFRTPTGIGQIRAFLEGDFASTSGAFRLRHAYAQYKAFLVGQTWSTFSDPEAAPEELDFEGVSGRNIIRQAQFRYSWIRSDRLRGAVALETPAVSVTGGRGVNFVPDAIASVRWRYREDSHIQAAVVLREVRGQADLAPDVVKRESGWGLSISGNAPFRFFDLTDSLVFQVNGGVGVARYINDLNALQGQDGVFHPITGDLEVLPVLGAYVGYQHMWARWQTTRDMNLRSTLIWSTVRVNNLESQLPSDYKRTNRLSLNVIFSPETRLDVGIEYIWGSRTNKDGQRGDSSQVQFVTLFRF